MSAIYHFIDNCIQKVLRRKGVLLVGAVGLGILVRLFHLMLIDTNRPFHLGGLYYEFAFQILHNSFRLPVTIPYYTANGIPFAYPPLAFYLEAVLISFVPKFLLVNLLPPLIAALSVILIALLAKSYFNDFWGTFAAILSFALFRLAFEEQMEAAGLAEASGTIVVIVITYLLLKAKLDWRTACLLGITLGLGFLTAPGVVLASGLAAVLYTLKCIISLRKELRKAILLVVLTGGISIVIIAPFVLTITAYHGIQTFTQALAGQASGPGPSVFSGVYNLLRVEAFVDANATFPSAWLWNALVGFGYLWGISRRRWTLVAWAAGLQMIPREGFWMAVIPTVLLMSGAAIDIFGAATVNLLRQNYNEQSTRIIASAIFIFCLVSVLPDTASTIAVKVLDKDGTMTNGQFAAEAWAGSTTPANSNFIVLSNDNLIEWFPQITRRTVLNEPFGAEWKPKDNAIIRKFNAAVFSCNADTACYERMFDQVPGATNQLYVLFDTNNGVDPALFNMKLPEAFSVVYHQDGILITRYNVIRQI